MSGEAPTECIVTKVGTPLDADHLIMRAEFHNGKFRGLKFTWGANLVVSIDSEYGT